MNDPVLNKQNFTVAQWILTDTPKKFGLVMGLANPTGVVLCVILVIMIVSSQPFVRRGGSFEVRQAFF